MKNFEMPKINKISFAQYDYISGLCGAVDDTVVGGESNPEFD